ncbi:hypothetical protein VNI00_003040 [Paramarasmius palmivorus]|uniref:DUF6533 domain-containing protein n=1 Tax=Paramarasmius palmivorus TaxID=297713 RepID=A0AAW0DXZ4_9AGAR
MPMKWRRSETDPTQAQPDELLGSYIAVGTLAIFLWDVLTNLSSEYHLLFNKRKIGFPTIVYLWARVTTLVGLTLTALVFAAPIGKCCSIFTQIILAGFPSFIASESLLVFFRLRAVYMDRKGVIRAFLVSLIIVVGCSCSLPFVGEAHRIGSTNAYCTATLNTKLAEAMLIIPLINHIAVFLAISYQLMPKSEISDSVKSSESIIKAISGNRLHGLSRTLVIDGQKYILVFLITTTLAAVIIAIGDLPDTYRFVLVGLHIAIENSMNSYLFRSVRAKASSTDVLGSTMNFRHTESDDLESSAASEVPQSV